MYGLDDTLRKQKKIIETVRIFIAAGGPSMEELAQLTGYSSSSVQRYLWDPYVKDAFGEKVADTIKEYLERNKREGISKGGVNSTSINISERDSVGKFTGNKKR